jgi:hypothetical protein
MAYTQTHATRRQYLAALLQQPVAWIRGSMNHPSDSMLRKPSTIALHRIALRRLTGSAS